MFAFFHKIPPLTPSSRRKREEDSRDEEDTPSKKVRIRRKIEDRKQEPVREARAKAREDILVEKKEENPGEAKQLLSELRDQGSHDHDGTISNKGFTNNQKSIKDNPQLREDTGRPGEAFSQDGGGQKRVNRELLGSKGGTKPQPALECSIEDGAL